MKTPIVPQPMALKEAVPTKNTTTSATTADVAPVAGDSAAVPPAPTTPITGGPTPPPPPGASPIAQSADAPEDPRLGLPSASRLEQLRLCPGSGRAQQGLAEVPREDAASGRRIHQWLAGHATPLTPAELETAQACRAQQRQLLARFTASQPAAESVTGDAWPKTNRKPGTLLPEASKNAAISRASAIAKMLSSPTSTVNARTSSNLKRKCGHTQGPSGGRIAHIEPGTLLCARVDSPMDEEFVEHRFWLRDDARRAVMSGQADWVVIRGRRALIVDFKTGHGAVTASPRNPQLMALAVMLAGERPELEEILTAIIQPAVSEAPLCAVYDRPALAHARTAILRTLDAARAADAPLVAGPHQCQYCRAKAQCPAARELLGALAVPASLEPVTNPQLAQLLARCGTAEQTIAALRAEARRRLEAGQEIPGWRLKPGAWRERVLDARAVFDRLTAWGVTASEFTALCAVTKTALKTLLQEKAGLRGAALEAALASVLEGLTESHPTAPTLVQG